MVRKSTASAPATTAPATSASASAAPAITTAPVTVAAAAAEPAVKKSRKVTKPAEPVVSVAPVVSDVAAPDATVIAAPVDAHSEILLRFVEFGAKLQTASSILSAIRTEYKLLEKQTAKELKKKGRGKNRKVSGNRQPSGFIKPTLITNELAEFLGKPHGVEMARTEVSKEINNYIKQHDLKDPANGRNINPDQKLSGLLKLGQEDKLTYFNLQKFMKHHFVKETATAAVASV